MPLEGGILGSQPLLWPFPHPSFLYCSITNIRCARGWHKRRWPCCQRLSQATAGFPHQGRGWLRGLEGLKRWVEDRRASLAGGHSCSPSPTPLSRDTREEWGLGNGQAAWRVASF